MSADPKKTVEYRPDNTKLMIIVRENGKETATIIANTIPASAEQRIRELEHKSS